MTRPHSIRVKICCIASVEEAALAIRYGASAIGLVSAMPSGPGPIPEPLIATIASSIPPTVETFLLTSKQTADEVLRQIQTTNIGTVQIVDRFPVEGYRDLRAARPGIRIVQAVHVTGPEAIAEAESIAPHVDALLLDSGNQSLRVKELGGTGRVHDWTVSRTVCGAVGIPVFLAGGLTPDNVADAVSAVRPYGVDVCSGVRTDGKLDEKKLKLFFQAMTMNRKSSSDVPGLS